MNLTELANRYGSDKGSEVGDRHKYTYLYDVLFAPLKTKELNFVEIGLAIGKSETPERVAGVSPSVSMWLEYFSRAIIFGFDISDFSCIRQSRFKFVQGDAGSEEDLKRLADSSPEFSIIIDDGSHTSFHQQLALKTLWPKLAPGGLYVIEDLHWQPLRQEKSLPFVPKTATFLLSFFERATYLKNALWSEEELGHLKGEIMSIVFFPSFDSGPRTKYLIKALIASILRLPSAARRPWASKLCVIRKKVEVDSTPAEAACY